MLDLLKYLNARFGEPSTYNAVALLLVAAHVNVPAGAISTATLWGAVASSVLGVILKEVGSKSSTAIASDALGALVTALKAMPEQGAKVASAVMLMLVFGGAPIALIVAPVLLAGCATTNGVPSLSPQAITDITALCLKDAQLQPLEAADEPAIAALASAFGAALPVGLGTAQVLDNVALHPFVQGLCAQFEMLHPLPAAAPVAATPAATTGP